MYFTKNDIKQLLDVLKLNSKKDTEFEVANDLVGDENIALIQKGENKISTLNHLSSFVLKDITYDLNAEKTARENADKVHDDALTTHTKQITTLQTKVQDVIVVNTEQQTAINSQGIRLTEVEHRADEHDTKIAQINTDMKQMDDNILRHGEEIEDLQEDIATKQQELTLTVLDNGNIRIGNLQGQTKDFMPATPSGDPMHYAYSLLGRMYNNNSKYNEGEDVIVTTVWGDKKLVDDADYNARWGLNLIPEDAKFVKILNYEGKDREIWEINNPLLSNRPTYVVAEYSSDGTKIWDDRVMVARGGMWRLFGLGDLTNDDMRKILMSPYVTETMGSCGADVGRVLCKNGAKSNFEIKQYFTNGQPLEVIGMGYKPFTSSEAELSCKSFIPYDRVTFNYKVTALNLQYVVILAGKSIVFNAPKISARSIMTLINNTSDTVTITFPSALYDRLMDTSTTLGAELVALLESKSNITFARGE